MPPSSPTSIEFTPYCTDAPAPAPQLLRASAASLACVLRKRKRRPTAALSWPN